MISIEENHVGRRGSFALVKRKQQMTGLFIYCVVDEENGRFIMKPTIIMDAGHGGFDNGASYEGRREKDDNLRLTLAVGERLEELGFPVVYTRTTDVYQRPVDKARIGNESGGDYFVSIHRNSAVTPNRYNGVQTLVYNDAGVPAELARNINRELEMVGFRDIGVEERKDLAVLRRTSMPAILVEAGFINSAEDNRIFDQNFDAMANAIAMGIENTVGDVQAQPVFARSEKSSVGKKESAQARDREYGVQVGLFRRFENAQYRLEELLEQGFGAEIVDKNGYFAVTVKGQQNVEAAREMEKELRKRGYDTLIVTLP